MSTTRFKRCTQCAAKIPDSDGHAKCLYCLGEAHVVGTCRFCLALTAQARKNRAARLRAALYEKSLAPEPAPSTSGTKPPLNPGSMSAPTAKAPSVSSKASRASRSSKAAKPPCTLTTATVSTRSGRVGPSSTSSSVASVSSARSHLGAPPSTSAMKIAFKRAHEEARRTQSDSAMVPPTPGKSLRVPSKQPLAKKRATQRSSSSASSKMDVLSSATSSRRSSPIAPAQRPRQPSPQQLSDGELQDSPHHSTQTVVRVPSPRPAVSHRSSRQQLFPPTSTPERGRQTTRLARAAQASASKETRPQMAPALEALPPPETVLSSPPQSPQGAGDDEIDIDRPDSSLSASVVSLGLDLSPPHDAYEVDPPSPTDNIRAFSEQMIRMADALGLEIKQTSKAVTDPVFKRVQAQAPPATLLPFLPYLLDVIQSSWKTPSSIPPTSKRIESWYRTDDDTLEWLKHHPDPNSMVVKASQSSGRESTTPADREGKRFDAVGRKLYSGALLLCRMANYGACMGAYQQILWEKAQPFFSKLSDEDRSVMSTLQQEADSLAHHQIQMAKHTGDTAGKMIAHAIAIRRHAWLRSSGLSSSSRQVIEDLPFDAMGLFNSGTDDKLKTNHDFKVLATKCGDQPQTHRTKWFPQRFRRFPPPSYRQQSFRRPSVSNNQNRQHPRRAAQPQRQRGRTTPTAGQPHRRS
ncbi:nucleolar and coiled-body phosphoprotein 1-like [Anolis carolinensis]|uniref:nucleolar and coiled-body phosphoprotein 1-like n=1 Tax=Anolis carolinensis TaxID=28377 RepID=UPI002F2B474D